MAGTDLTCLSDYRENMDTLLNRCRLYLYITSVPMNETMGKWSKKKSKHVNSLIFETKSQTKQTGFHYFVLKSSNFLKRAKSSEIKLNYKSEFFFSLPLLKRTDFICLSDLHQNDISMQWSQEATGINKLDTKYTR